MLKMTSSKPLDTSQSMSSEDMIAHSSHWTLALDNAVLNRLKKFSEVVDTASQEINTDCDRLAKDINCLQSRIANVTNEFLMLSNTQFVENRVQEFEETMEANNVQSAVDPDKTKTKAEKEAELFAKMKEAIQIGVSASPIHDKRSSENVSQKEAPPSLNLPHLIGTAKFFSSKYCGLTDDSKSAFIPPVNEYLPTNPDNFPIQSVYSASSDSLPSTTASVDTAQSHENLPKVKEPLSINSHTRGNTPQLDNTEQSSEQMNSDSESNENKNIPVAKGTLSVVEELNNAFRARVPPPPENTESDSDDDFKPSASGRKLFDDDDDDLFGEKSLFAGRQSEDNFGLPKSGALSNSQPTFPQVDDISNKNSLFDDDGFDFESKTVSVQPVDQSLPVEIRTEVKPKSEEGSTVSSKPKIPAGAVPMFGGIPKKPTLKSSIQKTDEKRAETENIQSSQSSKRGTESSQTIEKEHKNTSHPSRTSNPPKIDSIPNSSHQDSTQPHHKSKTTNSQTKSKKVNSLFDDLSDDDLFTPSKFIDKKSNNSLFDNTFAKSNPHSLPSKTSHTKPKGIVKHSIFDDSDSGDDLFSSASSTSSKTKEKSVINVSASGIPVFKPVTRMFAGRATESLFDDENDDIFIKDKKAISAASSSRRSESKELLNSNQNKLFPGEDSLLSNNKDVYVKRDVIGNQRNEKHAVSSPVVSGPKEVVVTVHNHTRESHSNDLFKESNATKTSESTPKVEEEIKSDKQNVKQKEGDIVDADSFPNSSNVVARPQSLHIQSVNLPSKDTRSFQKEDDIFSENTDQFDSHVSDDRKLNMGSKSVEDTTISENSLVNASTKTIFDGQGQSQEPSTPTTQKSSVKDIANSLKINPLALRPGYRPPKPESATTPTFDKTLDSDSSGLLSSASNPETESTPTDNKEEAAAPESTGLLSSAAKHRPKIMQKRRLPSRKLRNGHFNADKDSVQRNSISEEDNKTHKDEGKASVSSSIRSGDEHSEPPSPMVPKDILSPSTEEEDIFSIGIESNHRFSSGAEKSSPEDMFLFPKPNSSDIQEIANENFVSQPDILKANSDENNKDPGNTNEKVRTIVNTSVTKISVTKRIPLPSSRITQCSDSDSDDLFPAVGRKSFPDSSLQQKSKENSVVKIDNYASTSSSISETLITSKIEGPVLDSKMSASESKEVLDDSAPSRNNTDQKSRIGNRVINRSKSLFSDEDDEDDDIFASKMKPATSAEASKINEKKTAVNASSNPVSEKAPVPKKQKGLFDSDSDDGNDIFGGKRKKSTVFASAKNSSIAPDSSSAQRKNTQKAVVKNSLFNDSSDEDIFTSSLNSKQEAKRNVTPATNSGAPSSAKAKKTNDDIFDDPLNS